MHQNQNTNEQAQTKEVVPVETQESIKPATPETLATAPDKTTGGTPVLSTQPQTINHKQETAEMEVHKHPHHVMHSKKWNEYLLEFFMLFLAVTLGFFAEGLREHISDKQKEKDYIVSLVADLKADIKNADQTISESKTFAGLLDSMFAILNDPVQIKKQGNFIYYAGRLGPRIGTYVNNQRTFDQLNSGGYRLIQNLEVSNKIIDYYALFPHLRLLENGALKEFEHYQVFASNIFDPVVFRRQENTDGEITIGNNNPPLLTYDAKLLKQLGLYIVYLNGSRRSIIPDLKNIKQKANELVQFLQNKYDLQ